MLIGVFLTFQRDCSDILGLHTFVANARLSGWHSCTGPAIGLVEGAHYRLESCALHAGDLLLSYTDGVNQTMNPVRQLFGKYGWLR